MKKNKKMRLRNRDDLLNKMISNSVDGPCPSREDSIGTIQNNQSINLGDADDTGKITRNNSLLYLSPSYDNLKEDSLMEELQNWDPNDKLSKAQFDESTQMAIKSNRSNAEGSPFQKKNKFDHDMKRLNKLYPTLNKIPGILQEQTRNLNEALEELKSVS